MPDIRLPRFAGGMSARASWRWVAVAAALASVSAGALAWAAGSLAGTAVMSVMLLNAWVVAAAMFAVQHSDQKVEAAAVWAKRLSAEYGIAIPVRVVLTVGTTTGGVFGFTTSGRTFMAALASPGRVFRLYDSAGNIVRPRRRDRGDYTLAR
jgi:hypothetical protein